MGGLLSRILWIPKDWRDDCAGRGCFDPSVHLGVNDIALNSVKSPSILRVMIKQLKTDPFPRGVELYVGHSNSNLCPVAAILSS